MNMRRGEHSFSVGEGEEKRTYDMVLDANAFCEIEDVLDLSLPELLLTVQKKPGLKVFRALLYGALYEKHRLTIEECGNLMAEVGFELIADEIMKLVQNVLPSGEAGPPEGNRAQRRATAAARSRNRGIGTQPSELGAKQA